MKSLATLLASIALVLLAAPALRAADVINTLGNATDASPTAIGASGFPQFARAFDTGGSATRLAGITVRLSEGFGENSARVQLWSGSTSTNIPQTLVEDLGTLPVTNGGYNNHTFPSITQPVLTPNTRYWVSVGGALGNNGFLWGNSTSSASNSSFFGASLANARASSPGRASSSARIV